MCRAIVDRHLDLFEWTPKSVRVPKPGLDLKTISAYFGISRLSPIYDGLAAELLYGRYRAPRSEDERAELRASLIDYNRDDLDALVGVAARLGELSVGPDRLD